MSVTTEIMALGTSGALAQKLTDSFVESGAANTFTGTQTFGDGIATDTIAEETAAAGVTIDGVLLKDNNATVTDLDAGASGTAGTVDIFPSTAASGKIQIAAANSAGDTTTTITNASQAGARTYTIPDAGASASFVMTAGAQTIGGVKTFSSGIAFGASATFDADSGTVTLSSNAGTLSKMAGVITTESLTTAAGSGQDLTITNTLCATTDLIFVTRTGGTSANGTPILKAVPGNGSFVITVDNKHASAAFNGTFIISFLLVKA